MKCKGCAKDNYVGKTIFYSCLISKISIYSIISLQRTVVLEENDQMICSGHRKKVCRAFQTRKGI